MKTGDLHNNPRIYMALAAETEEREKLQFLTTQVMRWSDGIWILDISPFVRYWRRRAQAAGSTVLGLWRTALERVFPAPDEADREKVVSISVPYRAACAVNPWLAVLMLDGMQARGISGLIWQESRTGRALLSGCDWDCWWRGAAVLSDHFLAAGRKGFKPAKFRKQIHRLKLAALRLGLRCPGEMKILNEAGVQKRFGPELALLWRWRFDPGAAGFRDPAGGSESAPFLYRIEFPWQVFRFRASPLVKRSPDYALERWEQVAPLLKEDLDKLCRCLEQSGEQVIRLDWRVTLEDMRCLHVPIRFRNPHDLRREAGDHRTALLQARYAFEDAVRDVLSLDSETGESEGVLLICHWELTLSETLVVPDICLDIFGEIAEKEEELEILLRLENELPVALHRFSARRDWLPEDSFSPRELALEDLEPPPDAMQRSLAAVAETRPLYIRSDPLPLAERGFNERGRFLESTLDKWWQKAGPALTERHYFKHIDADGNATWVFQDSAGVWYQHGIFG